MKKKTLLFGLIMGSLVLAFGQTKPVAKNLGLGFRITGISDFSLDEWRANGFDIPEVLVRYYLMDRLALRATVGLDVTNGTSEYYINYVDDVRFANPTVIDSSAKASVSQFGLSISPGIEYHLAPALPKLDPYIGAELPVSFIGVRSETLDNEFTQTEGGVVQYKEDLNVRTNSDGGLMAGLNLLAGFNYFITDNIALGAEYALGVNYSQVGGDIRIATTGVIQPTSNADNQVTVDSNVQFTNLVTNLGVSVGATAGINFSIFW